MTMQRQLIGSFLILGLALAFTTPVGAQTSSGSTTKNSSASPSGDAVKGDNTKLNRTENPTADQQKENTSDRELTQRIRRAVTQDKTMSTYARNVKIIAQDGKVTLKGPVGSEEEKKAIEDKAAEVAGEGNVTSQIRVVPKKG